MLQSQKSTSATSWHGFPPEFVAGMAIASLTLLAYANVVASFYLYADEVWVFGKSLATADLGYELWMALTTIGRPVGVFFWWLQSLTVEWDLDFLVMHRVLSLAAVAAIAYLIYRDQPRRALGALNLAWLPLGTALFTVLLPAAQIHAAFAALLGPSLGLLLSYASYRWLVRPLGWLWTILTLFFCMTIYQPSPFFILVPFALDLWRRYEDGTSDPREFVLRRGTLVITVLLAASIAYTIGFKITSSWMQETQLYPPARPLLGILSGDFGPFLALMGRAGEGLNVFEIWSYPPNVPYLWWQRYTIYLIVVVVIIALNVTAVFRSADARERSRRMWVVLGFAGAFGASLVPVVADGFSVRQNLYYPCQVLIVLNIGYAVSLLARGWQDLRLAILVVTLVIVVQSFMTSSSVFASIIRPQLLGVDYVAMKLHEAAPPGSKVALVVSLSKTEARCRFEPCLAYYGRRFNAPWEWTLQAGFYERVAQRFGYEIVAYGFLEKPADPRRLPLGEPLVIIDLDELRSIYDSDKIQM
jgi:hypothetical protein